MKIRTIESHAAGEPLRIVTEGWPRVPGRTMLEKRAYARSHHDNIRRALMFEPRGHADMYGAVTTEPVTPDGDLGVLFLHNEGFSSMCGHGIIALVTALIEAGRLTKKEIIRIDSPAGRVTARPRFEGERVRSVIFENVPSFVHAAGRTVDVPGIGAVRYDLAFGGAYYAYCDAADLGVGLRREDCRALIDVGMRVKLAVMASGAIVHPTDPDLGFLYGTIISGPSENANLRNVCIFAEGQVDRSPTGTGVSGRVAIEHGAGRLAEGAPFVVESILGTKFTGRVLRSAQVGPYAAVVPEVEGSAHVIGESLFTIDATDPLRHGFFLR